MKKHNVLLFLAATSLALVGCGNRDTTPSGDKGYTVKFNPHGGTAVADKVNVKVIEEEPQTTRDEYDFKGWYDSTGYTNKINFPYTVTRDITLHAYWEKSAPTTYTVSFDTDGGTPVATMSNVSVISTEPVTTRDGYDFLGWFASKSSTTKITFPYVVDYDQTLYAKWKVNIVYDDVEIMKVTTSKGTATAYMKASYETNYLDVTVRVIDKYVFNSYTNSDGSVNGMNDNVEIYVSPRTNEPVGLIDNETHVFLAVPGKGYQAKKFLSSPDYKYNWNYGAPFKSGYQVSSKICTEASEGFNGYLVDFKIPYSLFNSTRANMLGKTAIYLAMRNTDPGVPEDPTVYAESTFLAAERRNVWTHPVLNEQNQFVNKKIDTLLIGDSYTDSEFFKNLKFYFEGKNFYGRGISGSKASEWVSKYYPNIIASEPKDIVIHIGVNDIDDGHDQTGVNTFNTIKTLVEKIHTDLPDTKIHWITITDNHFLGIFVNGVNPYVEGYHYVNDHMKQLATSLSYLSIIDYAAKTEGQISFFLNDGLHPNGMGYDMLTDLIYQELEYSRSTGTVFGKSGKLTTSFGFDLSKDNEQIIETNGNYNQYAWVNNESGKISFSFEVGMSAIQVNHGDAYPKMGIVVKSDNRMLFFYIDMYASLNGKVAGYVFHENKSGDWGTDFNWSSSQSVGGLNINYTNNNYVDLKAVYSNGNLELYVNGVKQFTVNSPFGGEAAYFGLLSFNTAFKTNKVVIE